MLRDASVLYKSLTEPQYDSMCLLHACVSVSCMAPEPKGICVRSTRIHVFTLYRCMIGKQLIAITVFRVPALLLKRESLELLFVLQSEIAEPRVGHVYLFFTVRRRNHGIIRTKTLYHDTENSTRPFTAKLSCAWNNVEQRGGF